MRKSLNRIKFKKKIKSLNRKIARKKLLIKSLRKQKEKIYLEYKFDFLQWYYKSIKTIMSTFKEGSYDENDSAQEILCLRKDNEKRTLEF